MTIASPAGLLARVDHLVYAAPLRPRRACKPRLVTWAAKMEMEEAPLFDADEELEESADV